MNQMNKVNQVFMHQACFIELQNVTDMTEMSVRKYWQVGVKCARDDKIMPFALQTCYLLIILFNLGAKIIAI